MKKTSNRLHSLFAALAALILAAALAVPALRWRAALPTCTTACSTTLRC